MRFVWIGLDIAGLSHVINLDLPTNSRAYLHRAGRVERTGSYKDCQVYTLCFFPVQIKKLQRMANELQIPIQAMRFDHGKLVPHEETSITPLPRVVPVENHDNQVDIDLDEDLDQFEMSKEEMMEYMDEEDAYESGSDNELSDDYDSEELL